MYCYVLCISIVVFFFFLVLQLLKYIQSVLLYIENAVTCHTSHCLLYIIIYCTHIKYTGTLYIYYFDGDIFIFRSKCNSNTLPKQTISVCKQYIYKFIYLQ